MSQFQEMRAFVRIVDLGSFTQAAASMDLAKSAVSRRLSELEERLGVQLIIRSTRRLSITDAGRRFYLDCIRLLSDLEEAESSVASDEAALSGKLKIAAPLSFGVLHLGPAINEFVSLHTDLQLELDFDDRRVDLVAEGFDLAIRIGELTDSSLRQRRLTPIRHLVCASPEFWKKFGKPDAPDELEQLQGLHYSNLGTNRWRYQAPDGVTGSIRLPSRIRASNGDFLKDAAIAGLGIVIAPTFLLYRAIKLKQLEPVLCDYHWLASSAWAVYPEARHVSLRVRKLIDFLVVKFGDAPYWDEGLAVY